MNYFNNFQYFDQYYTNTCKQLIPLNMNISEIVKYVTNPTCRPHDKGEYFEWQLFNWLNINGFTPSKTTCRTKTGEIKGDGGIDLFATGLVNNQRVNLIIQSKCYVSPHSSINEEIVSKFI